MATYGPSPTGNPGYRPGVTRPVSRPGTRPAAGNYGGGRVPPGSLQRPGGIRPGYTPNPGGDRPTGAPGRPSPDFNGRMPTVPSPRVSRIPGGGYPQGGGTPLNPKEKYAAAHNDSPYTNPVVRPNGGMTPQILAAIARRRLGG